MGSSASETKIQKWKSHMAAAESFAGGIEAYCKSQGLYTSSFYTWRRKLSLGSAPRTRKNAQKNFLPLRVHPDIPKLKAVAPALPDPRWVAEVLTHLARGLS